MHRRIAAHRFGVLHRFGLLGRPQVPAPGEPDRPRRCPFVAGSTSVAVRGRTSARAGASRPAAPIRCRAPATQGPSKWSADVFAHSPDRTPLFGSESEFHTPPNRPSPSPTVVHRASGECAGRASDITSGHAFRFWQRNETSGRLLDGPDGRLHFHVEPHGRLPITLGRAEHLPYGHRSTSDLETNTSMLPLFANGSRQGVIFSLSLGSGSCKYT